AAWSGVRPRGRHGSTLVRRPARAAAAARTGRTGAAAPGPCGRRRRRKDLGSGWLWSCGVWAGGTGGRLAGEQLEHGAGRIPRGEGAALLAHVAPAHHLASVLQDGSGDGFEVVAFEHEHRAAAALRRL